MKFAFALSALMAVSAESATTCTTPAGDDAWLAATLEAADAAACKTACVDAATALTATQDYCCAASTVPKAGDVEAVTTCTGYSKATGAADIRAALADTETLVSEAWAWVALVASADLAAASADSSNMLASAAATLAAVSMFLY